MLLFSQVLFKTINCTLLEAELDLMSEDIAAMAVRARLIIL